MRCSINFSNSQEANVYIANLVEKFGAFHMAKPNKIFIPSMLNEYISQLIPGAAKLPPTDSFPSYRADSKDEVPVKPKSEPIKFHRQEYKPSVNGSKLTELRQRNLFELKSAPTRRNSLPILCHSLPRNSTPLRRKSTRSAANMSQERVLTVDLTFTDDESVNEAPNLKRTSAQIDDTEEPPAKHPRLSNDATEIKLERTEQNNVSGPALIEVPRNEVSFADDEQTNRLEHLKLNMNQSVNSFTAALDEICSMNDTLKRDLQFVEAQREADIKELDHRNANLLEQIEELKKEKEGLLQTSTDAHGQEITKLKQTHAQEIEGLREKMETEWEKKLKAEIQTLNAAHELEMARMRLRYTDRISKLQAEKGQSNGQTERGHELAVEQMKQEYLKMIDDAKMKKFCVVCRQSKLLDLYVCGWECQKKMIIER